MTSLRRITVVVPARNEQAHVAACLDSLRTSANQLRREYPGISCDVVVVLDCCTDQTGTLADGRGVRTIVSTIGRVGAARHLGALDAVAKTRRAGLPDDAVWLANTDADTTVPPNWLAAQVQFADAGFDAVIGTVTPDGLDRPTARLWQQRHRLAEGHDHVHGANLGIRADLYMTVGGFAAVSLHEDLDLVNRVKAHTRRWTTTHRTNVRTSARKNSRVEGGFASYVADLGSEGSSCA
ncbi:glycosyltransferase family 2 protein [Mycobacterium cookii]|uniref:4,4'-diaponeurosporenoate glycosyltransferase n=1 Tax=Mycobacterium cookii TaxID=1775 RepID=A0A7I7KZW2_9MYCO|nr:glycosyltransferase [Mycobacterium cookii]MCV7330550.1 glycosyltransferase [Mycobacterium cookii]BBX47259.1 glycosyl transferase [Mycobacterium cookii]